jgi:iron complex transport system ATP-binding protein
VFTDEQLSKCFGLPLQIERQEGRWHARAVAS